jgi:hypothetical protein
MSILPDRSLAALREVHERPELQRSGALVTLWPGKTLEAAGEIERRRAFISVSERLDPGLVECHEDLVDATLEDLRQQTRQYFAIGRR